MRRADNQHFFPNLFVGTRVLGSILGTVAALAFDGSLASAAISLSASPHFAARIPNVHAPDTTWRHQSQMAMAPFQEFSVFFGPDELDAMTTAYNAVWCQLVVAVTPNQVATIKRKLAQIILAAACTGERKSERLKDVALRALSARL